jgi:hypothetical protein
MNSLSQEAAGKLCAALKLAPEVGAALRDFPHKDWEEQGPDRSGDLPLLRDDPRLRATRSKR